jgi:hypothetical protein
MHNCPFCKNPLRPWTECKGSDGRFYCSEFCSDAGGSSTAATWDAHAGPAAPALAFPAGAHP